MFSVLYIILLFTHMGYFPITCTIQQRRLSQWLLSTHLSPIHDSLPGSVIERIEYLLSQLGCVLFRQFHNFVSGQDG